MSARRAQTVSMPPLRCRIAIVRASAALAAIVAGATIEGRQYAPQVVGVAEGLAAAIDRIRDRHLTLQLVAREAWLCPVGDRERCRARAVGIALAAWCVGVAGEVRQERADAVLLAQLSESGAIRLGLTDKPETSARELWADVRAWCVDGV